MKIEKVAISVSNFEETVRFYEETLQFPCLSYAADRASFQIGASVLELHRDEEHRHYYHFAFNIPRNLFRKAKEWLAGKVELLTEDGEDEVDFSDRTQANACYFEDPAGNIVEYIARRETSPASARHTFSADQVLSISEIGLTTDEIAEYAKQMQAIGIPLRDDEELSFDTYLNFMGEYEDGAFILLGPVGRRWLFSTKVAVAGPVAIHTDKGVVSNRS